MLKIRTTKTGSKNLAIQVVERFNHRTKIIKHVGTAKNEEEKVQLIKLAENFIQERNDNLSIFPEYEDNFNIIKIDNLEIINCYHNFAYKILSYFYELNGFDDLKNELLKDLSIIRIIEPVSKIKSIELINEYFGITHKRSTMYRNLTKIDKDKIQTIAVNYAKKYLNFDFSLVFYDITTLYFEAFEEDELRKCGFSKDNKANQPQILIALVVNSDGYPINISIFEGNKFEGHTMIPVILDLKKKHNINQLTIVADTAMLSYENMTKLNNIGINYIVGARLSYLQKDKIKEISTHLNTQENVYYDDQTKYGRLVCDYSKKRASKDQSDRKKQLLRAEKQIKDGVIKKKAKFIKEITKSKYCLNQELIDKLILLDGLKGYYTNLKGVNNSLIVSRYKDLWNVEKSFRMAKYDLIARPIFHRKKEAIEAHILIIFISMCISKSIELKTNISIKKFKHLIWKIIDVEFIDKLTQKKFNKRKILDPVLENLLRKINFTEY